MIAGRLPLLAAALLALAPAAAADHDLRVLVPSVARTGTSAADRWWSELVIHNPMDGAVRVSATWIPRGDASPPAPVVLTVAGRGSILVGDVLDELLGVADGAGGLLLEPDGPIVASSRTATTTSGGPRRGQHVPGLPLAELAGVRQNLLPHLTHTGAFRTNLGFVNLGWDELLAWTVPIAFGVPSPKARMLEIPAAGAAQLDGLLGEAGPVEDGMFWIETDFLSGPFVAWASVIDNRTGDARLVTPVRPVESQAYLLGTAHGNGIDARAWRTEVEVVGDPFLPVRYRLEWLPAGAHNGSPDAVEVELGPGEARRHRDVVATDLGGIGIGSVRVTAVEGHVLASAHTFTGADGGTIGHHVRALHAAEATPCLPGARAVAVHLRDDGVDDDAGFRTDLLLQSTSAAPITVTAEVRDAAGDTIGEHAVDLAPYGFDRVEGVARRVRAGGAGVAAATLRCSGAGGAFLAVATVLDGIDGDPILVPAVRLPSAPGRADPADPAE